MNAVLEAVVVIGVDVAVVGGRQGVAAGQDPLDRPLRCVRLPRDASVARWFTTPLFLSRIHWGERVIPGSS